MDAARNVHLFIIHHSSFIIRTTRSARMSVRTQALLWAAQRASAAVLALCVIVHLATIIYAVRNGLGAAEILGRTRGNAAWFAFYALFVAAVAVHAPIGLRSILSETFNWRGRALDAIVLILAVALAISGLRAAWAVFASP
jgi:fumarate reductase subunit C